MTHADMVTRWTVALQERFGDTVDISIESAPEWLFLNPTIAVTAVGDSSWATVPITTAMLADSSDNRIDVIADRLAQQLNKYDTSGGAS